MYTVQNRASLSSFKKRFRNSSRVEGLGPAQGLLGFTCNPKNLQFYGLCLLIQRYLLLNCRLLDPQVGFKV